jgi:hypothetical protein
MVCGTIIYIAVAGEFCSRQADCHEYNCGKAPRMISVSWQRPA